MKGHHVFRIAAHCREVDFASRAMDLVTPMEDEHVPPAPGKGGD